MQQLESMVAGVRECVERLTVTNSVLTIVDFCSGAGHLGIILAHQVKCWFVVDTFQGRAWYTVQDFVLKDVNNNQLPHT